MTGTSSLSLSEAGAVPLERAPSLFSQSLPWAAVVGTTLAWLLAEHFPPWVSWHGEALAFLTVYLVAAAAVLGRLRQRPSAPAPFQVPRPALALMVIAAVAVVQGLTGRMPLGGDVLVVGFYLALCFAALALGFNIAPAGPTRDTQLAEAASLLAIALLVGAVISSALAFAQAFDVWYSPLVVRMPGSRQPGGNLAQPNQLATLLLLGVAATGFLAATRRLGPSAAAALFVLLAASLAATESRTGVVAFLVLTGWWQLKRRKLSPTWPAWIGPAAVMVFVGLSLAWPAIFHWVWMMDGVASTRLADTSQMNNMRLVIWPQLLEASLLKPWFGWGLLQVPAAHNAVAHAATLSEPYSYSHNIALDAVLGMGWPIALLLLGALALWLWRRIRTVDAPLPWFSLALVLVIGTHALLEFPHAYAYFLVPLMFGIGLLEAHRRERAVFALKPWALVPAMLAAGGLLVWSAIEYIEIEEDFRVIRFEALRIGQTPADHHMPEVVLLTQLGAVLQGARIELRPQMPAAELEQLRQLALRYPWTSPQHRYAVALALNGDMDEARRQLKVLRAHRGPGVSRRIQYAIDDMATRYPQLRDLRAP